MDPGAAGVRNMSTAEILRGIVAEKLTTAAQEIVAVVERTVAGYEEEASGLRQEIDRQRRQLELLLQLEIKLEPADDQFPVCGPAAGGGQLPAEDEQHKNDQSVGDGGSMGLHCYTEAQMEEEDEEEEDQDQEHLTEPDDEVASRLLTPTVESDRRSAGRPQISESQDHIDLRICILEDSRIKVLSFHVYRKYPVHELRCPRGLQEADFLDLLRSTFPQLAAQKPFDVFICQRTKKLQPLKVKTLTPEEICRSTSFTGRSALYIRLKNMSFENQAEEFTSTEEEFHPSQRKDAAADSPSTPDQNSLLLPRVQSDRKRPSRPQINEPQKHIDLRICILDSHIDVLSSRVYRKYPVMELQCPCGLQEADFLDLLRSTFPQLAAQKDFDFFTTDLKKRLQPLKVQTLTPEEISRSISSTGRSALYIRLKNTSLENQAEELTSTDDKFHPSQRNNSAADSPSTPDQTSLLLPRIQSDRSRSSLPWISEPQNHVDLRICILDSQIDVLSTRVYRKYPVMELQCRGGLQEADFLDLLRSTFPQLAAQKDFDFFTTDLKKRLQPLKVKTLTPEEIWRSISSVGSSAVYIRPKNMSFESQAEQLTSTEEFHPSQRNDAAADSPSTPDQTSLLSPRVQSDRKRPSSSQINEPQKRIYLRICILDSHIDVLSINVYKTYQVLRVQFPCGLQEADFLDLLRSTFPQLAAQKEFDFFTTDRKKKLEPLKVKTLTPEEISRSISSTGYSALYIRLKLPEEVQAREKEPQRIGAAFRVQLHRRRTRMRRVSELQNHIDLRICIVEDSQLEVLSTRVYKKYPVLLLQCPHGLEEADFLDLLRSTFPQLAAQKQFDFFTADWKKRLHRLKVKTLTPEKIISATGLSALYIRLKPPAEVKARKKEPQRKDAAADSASTDQTRLNTRDQSDSSRSDGRPQVSEPQKHVDLRICILEDSQLDVLSSRVYRKYPVLELQCPGGLQEFDFLDLLRSTFPQLADQKHFDFFTTDWKKKLQPLKVEMLTPEEISRSIRHSALYIRLKAQEEVQSRDEELRHADAAKDSSSTSEQTSLNTSSSRHEQHEDMETEDTDDEDGGRSESAPLLLSEGAEDGDDVSDDDRKPDKSEKRLRESEPEKTRRKQRVKTKRRKRMMSPLKAEKSDAPLSCKVCRAPRTSKNMLIKHAWRHVDDPERLCGVCGEQPESVEELRSHLHSHQKTHRCNICGKSFLSTHGLSGHVARHKGKKPYKCNICHKAFAQNWVLNHHKWVHEADRPHKCDICQKSFYSKKELARHEASHTGETLHRCGTCGKSLSSLESLSQHILRHSAKKAEFTCEICSRTFNTNQKLKMHRRSHRRVEPHVCSKCGKGFSSSSMLAAHVRVHTGEKPYKCSVCDMAFSHKHCMKRHMTTHHVGSDLCKTEAQILTDRINGAKSVEPVL